MPSQEEQMVKIVEVEGGYRKMIVLDDEGKETDKQYNLPKLIEVEGEFISTPPLSKLGKMYPIRPSLCKSS